MANKVISVVGLGYIGLPTAAMFASHGVNVIGVDVKKATVDTINRGEIHIIEPGLEDVVRRGVSDGLLRATMAPEAADAFLIAVPTPFKGENRDPDLSFIEAATKSIAPVLKAGDLVILESTSPVGATEEMEFWLLEARPDLSFPSKHGEQSDIRIAYCPERVLPGKVLEELISNDRVIGGVTARCAGEAKALYQTFVKGECVIASSPRAAEMTKLTENSFRDVNIAFANELSLICDKLNIDVWELIALANRHPRVNVLRPGPGVGGHCIAVDPWFIVSSAPTEAKLIRAARQINDGKPNWVLTKLHEAIDDWREAEVDSDCNDPVVACYGLAFKPDIDDLRDSPALMIAAAIASDHAGELLIVEPNVDALPPSFDGRRLVSTEQAQIADIHLFLVSHREFRNAQRPAGTIIDACGLWETI